MEDALKELEEFFQKENPRKRILFPCSNNLKS